MVNRGGNADQPSILNDLAYSTYLTRKFRNDSFNPDLFGEPAWDILLLLFSNGPQAEQFSAENLSRDLRLSEQLVTRWLVLLAKYDLVFLQSDRVELSDKGKEKLTTYLKRQIESLAQMLRTSSVSSASGSDAARNGSAGR